MQAMSDGCMSDRCMKGRWCAPPVGVAVPVLALLVALVLESCGDSGSAEPRSGADARPNVILISIDTLRADHLQCYGHDKPTSPFIDTLAERGVRFAHVFAQASWTLPSHMSLLTSRYPASHGVETQGKSLPASITTLAQVFSRNGYSTAAFVSWIYVSEKFGFGRGFDAFTELLPPEDKRGPGTRFSIKAGEFVPIVTAWARDEPQEPFFLFLHLFDPHMSYEPPLSHARLFDPEVADVKHGRYAAIVPYIKGLRPGSRSMPAAERERVAALYDGEIHYCDAELGRLFAVLKSQGLLENTLVVLTSDHGEEFGEHGSMEGHQWTLYDETTHIPLLIRFPRDEHAGTVVDDVVQSIDIAPTILDIIGIDRPEEFEGTSLLPPIRGELMDARPVFSSIRRFNRKSAVRTDRYKLILTEERTKRSEQSVTSSFELYDLSDDPQEQTNIYTDSSVPGRKLEKLLLDWQRSTMGIEAGAAPALSAEEQARLKAMGYSGSDD